MRRLFGLLLLTMPSISSGQQSKQQTFWAWFAIHDERLLQVHDAADPVLDSLGAALRQVHPDLTFEIGPAATPRELVLSADGIRAAFPEVEALYAAAPRLPAWRLVKFRPRRLPLNVLTIDQTDFDPSRVRFLLIRDEPGKVGIVLFFDEYDAAREKVFARAGYLMLDEAIGEYDMETRVGAIEFAGPESSYYGQAHPLSELPEAFDSQFRASAHE